MPDIINETLTVFPVPSDTWHSTLKYDLLLYPPEINIKISFQLNKCMCEAKK